MRRHRTFLLFACLLIAAPAVMAQTTVVADPLLSSDGDAKAWKRFTSKEGRFSILFPGEPTTSQESLGRPDLKFVMFKIQLRSVAEYGVIYADYPPSITNSLSADVLLDEGAKGAVAEVNSQLLSISPISVSGYPGRLLKERMPNGSLMQVKLVLVGQRLFQIAVTTAREDTDQQVNALYNTIARKFLDSFEVINPTTAESQSPAKSCAAEIANCFYVDQLLNNTAIAFPQPPYPPIARAAGAAGIVDVLVVIDESGYVISAKSISGHPLLQAAAAAAARNAKFSRPLIDNKPVKFSGILRYNFALE